MRSYHEPAIRLLALIGILILLAAILSLNIPFFKILITLGVAWAALTFADIGELSLRGISDDQMHGSLRTCRYVFSRAVIDLTDSSALPEKMILQTALSGVTVRLPVDVSSVIHASGALCSISIPGHRNIVLGESEALCGPQDPNAPRIYIDASCALGAITFEIG